MNVTERHYTKAVDAVSQAAMRKVSKGPVCEVAKGAPIGFNQEYPTRTFRSSMWAVHPNYEIERLTRDDKCSPEFWFSPVPARQSLS